MALQFQVLRELLDDEVEVARARLVDRLDELRRDGTSVYCRFSIPDRISYVLRLNGQAFDAEPFRVAAVDAHDQILPPHQWPAGLCNGLHPVLGIPFACIRGTYEFHTHTSHVTDVWDR